MHSINVSSRCSNVAISGHRHTPHVHTHSYLTMPTQRMHVDTHKMQFSRCHYVRSHAHLAKPGCPCTKQALWASASKLLEPGLRTCRRTDYYNSQLVGVGTRSPTYTHTHTHTRYTHTHTQGTHTYSVHTLINVHTDFHRCSQHNKVVIKMHKTHTNCFDHF